MFDTEMLDGFMDTSRIIDSLLMFPFVVLRIVPNKCIVILEEIISLQDVNHRRNLLSNDCACIHKSNIKERIMYKIIR